MEKDLKKQEFKKRLYKLVLGVIKSTNTLPKNTSNEIIIKQLIRSITSILANYIESQSASSKKDHINFFHHSLKSANESKVWLCLLKDTNQNENFEKYLSELEEISRILASSIITMKNRS